MSISEILTLHPLCQFERTRKPTIVCKISIKNLLCRISHVSKPLRFVDYEGNLLVLNMYEKSITMIFLLINAAIKDYNFLKKTKFNL